MGMTINDLITGLQSIKAFLDYSEFKGLEEQTKIQCSVIDGAIETMRKYQKIEQIFKTWCEVGDDGDISAFRDLRKVIEERNRQ